MPLLDDAPRFDGDLAVAIARERYGVDAVASALASERDQNFLLTASDGRLLVLKIANRGENRALLDAQNAAMSQAGATQLCPAVVLSLDGSAIVEVTAPGGGRHYVRVLTWIPGTPLGAVRYHAPALLEDLGRSVGRLDAALTTFDDPAIHRDFHWDFARGFDVVVRHAPGIADPALRPLVESIAADVARRTAPLLAQLPRAAVHNDPNDYNILVTGAGDAARVTGIIDFGDMVHGYAVGDLAIAIAYAVLDKRDPLNTAISIARGYHQARALSEAEIAALWDFVQLRLCMSAALAAWQTAQRPGDAYLDISQAPLVRTLPRLAELPPGLVEASLRQACGLDGSPHASRVSAWLTSCPTVAPVVDLGRNPIVLDLSVGSALVRGSADGNSERALTQRIREGVIEAGATSALGRYGEPRILYTSGLFAPGGPDVERRTIHLGLDIFAEPGTPVHAPLPGVVFASADNAAPLDYGPVIILQHRTGDGEVFYTLYGHLSRDSLAACPPGRIVGAGEPFATIGDAGVNGGWPTHLHVQIVTDLLDHGCDFPGVCRASERAAWKTFSPDPGEVLRIARASYPAEALDERAALATRAERVGRNLSVGYRRPLKAARGWMQYLYDESGRQYLDAYNNVPHVGHSHPGVTRAASEQMQVLNTNTRYVHDLLARYAAALAATLPEPLRVCYFVNSGSEANELALRLARAHTGRRAMVVLDAAYHGNTSTLIDISPYKFNGPGGQGAPAWVHVVPLPDVYRGEFRGDDAGERYATQASEAIAGTLGPGGNRLCGFIAETCPSVAGQVILPSGYLERMYRDVRAAGGVCIADEVQTAYGRTGAHFYAFDAHGVVPDIVVLGKPIGNGYPLGAVVTTRAIADSFDNGMEFFSTFGGSTAACAAGLAVLDVVEREGLQAHALTVGDHLFAGLAPMRDSHPLVGDVRGSGFFLGVDLVADRETRTPAPDAAAYVVNRMRDEGILIGTDGPFHNVLKIRPPMPFNTADADRLVETLGRVLSEWEAAKP